MLQDFGLLIGWSLTNLFPIYCVEIASSSKIRELGTKSVAANDATFFSVRRGIVFSKQKDYCFKLKKNGLGRYFFAGAVSKENNY